MDKSPIPDTAGELLKKIDEAHELKELGKTRPLFPEAQDEQACCRTWKGGFIVLADGRTYPPKFCPECGRELEG